MGDDYLREILKKSRIEKKLTTQDIADKIGVTKFTYSNIENGNRGASVEIWDKLEDLLQVDQRALRQNILGVSGNEGTPISKKLYDVEEFRSEILNNKVSKSTVYAKIKSGEIKAIKIGKRPFIPAWYVEDLLTSRNI